MSSRQLILDKTGIWASAICAIHCMAVPLIVSISAFSSWAFLHDESIENIVLIVSATIAIASLVPSYVKHHRRLLPLLVLLSGFFLIGLSRFMVNINEPVLASSGATLVASAHFFNIRFCKKFHAE